MWRQRFTDNLKKKKAYFDWLKHAQTSQITLRLTIAHFEWPKPTSCEQDSDCLKPFRLIKAYLTDQSLPQLTKAYFSWPILQLTKAFSTEQSLLQLTEAATHKSNLLTKRASSRMAKIRFESTDQYMLRLTKAPRLTKALGLAKACPG